MRIRWKRSHPTGLAVAVLKSADETRLFLHDHLRHANLQRQGNTATTAPDLRCTSNEDFWNQILRSWQPGLRWVELVHFQVTDWFPRTPGVYHTSYAASVRREAEHHKREEDGTVFYEPRGEFHMILGGLGTVRFKPVAVGGEKHWLCTATSDGYCHSGVPLAIPDHLMGSIESILVTLTGSWGRLSFYLNS